jgi:hypothetical protein
MSLEIVAAAGTSMDWKAGRFVHHEDQAVAVQNPVLDLLWRHLSNLTIETAPLRDRAGPSLPCFARANYFGSEP